ncbi:hypothetical protein JHC27_04765 [archaeon]|nr:hypothetical protein [archaeon]
MRLENLDKIKDVEYRELIEQYLEKILDVFNERVVGILLFGSVARGTAKPLSSQKAMLI